METWHNRLQTALTVRRKDWADLVKVTGLKKPSVYAWKPNATKRSTMMDGENAAKVCKFLGINAMWLFHDEGPSGLEEVVLSDVAMEAAVILNRYPPDEQLEMLHFLRVEYNRRDHPAPLSEPPSAGSQQESVPGQR
jgi:hypothetical protein